MGLAPMANSNKRSSTQSYTAKRTSVAPPTSTWQIPMKNPTLPGMPTTPSEMNDFLKENMVSKSKQSELKAGAANNKLNDYLNNPSLNVVVTNLGTTVIVEEADGIKYTYENNLCTKIEYPDGRIDKIEYENSKIKEVNTEYFTCQVTDYTKEEPIKSMDTNIENLDKLIETFDKKLNEIGTEDSDGNVITYEDVMGDLFSEENISKMTTAFPLDTVKEQLSSINSYMESDEYKNLSKKEKEEYESKKLFYEALMKTHFVEQGVYNRLVGVKEGVSLSKDLFPINKEEAEVLKQYFSEERRNLHHNRNTLLNGLLSIYYTEFEKRISEYQANGVTRYVECDIITSEEYLDILKSMKDYRKAGSDPKNQEDAKNLIEYNLSKFYLALSTVEVKDSRVMIDYKTFKQGFPHSDMSESDFNRYIQPFYDEQVDLVELLIFNPEIFLKYKENDNIKGNEHFTDGIEPNASGKYTYENYAQIFSYMTDEEREIAGNIYKLEGVDELNKYLEYKQDEINNRIGLSDALQIIAKMDPSDPTKPIETMAFEGFKDGLANFFEGLGNATGGADGKYSADDYQSMYLMELLTAKDLSKYGLPQEMINQIKKIQTYNPEILKGTYEVSSSIGNMTPAIVVSTIVSIYATPAAGKVLGNAMMGASAYGNEYEAMLQQGYSEYEASKKALFVGTSEIALGYILGGIPGLSKFAKLPGFKGFIANLAMEGGEEALQAILEPYFHHLATGEPYVVDWEEVKKAGIYGIITAGIMNGGSIGINGVTVSIENIGEMAIDVIAAAEAAGIEIDYTRINDPEYIKFLSENDAILRNISDLSISQIEVVISKMSTQQILDLVVRVDNETYSRVIQALNNNPNIDSSIKYMLQKNNNLVKNGEKTTGLDYYRQLESLKFKGYTETDALNLMLDEFATKYEAKGWASKEIIINSIKEAYKKTASIDNITFEEFLKIKFQMLDPKEALPNKYQQLENIVQKSDSAKIIWSPKVLANLASTSGFCNNGIGRAANSDSKSALFAIPSESYNETFPTNFNSLTPDEQAKTLGEYTGLDSSDFATGAFEITIDKSYFENSWDVSTPYTQGSNQLYVPGYQPTSDAYEFVIPRVDNVVSSIDSNLQVQIDKLYKAGKYDAITNLFLKGIETGKIKLIEGVNIKRISG